MSIRLPLNVVLSYDDVNNVGATSVAGGVAKTFTIPQDADNVVVKFQASTVGGGASVTFQTSDDGGTTWWDVQRTSVVSNSNGANAEWLSIPVISGGTRSFPSVVATGSIQTMTRSIGNVAASTLSGREVSGLPIMGQVNRVFIRYDAAVSANAKTLVEVKVNSQNPQT